MNEIMNYVMKKYGYLIKENNEGKRIADDNEIDALNLTPQEKGFVRLTFQSFGVEISKESIKEEITKDDRTGKVKDFDYGKIQSEGLEPLDKPVLATIKYEGETLVFEDYESLDEFIIHEFIPNNVIMKVNKSRNSKGLDIEKPYPSIQLNAIVKLKLSEKEVQHVVEVILKEGIRVGGTSQDLDSEFLNYDYIRTYATKRFEKPLSPKEEMDKFIDFYNTKDPMLREELIIRNLRLVPYVTWKLALRHDINHEELESYGYEGLIYAIDNFDPYLNCKFSTYAIPCILGYMKRAIPQEKDMPSKLYYAFQNVKYIIEKEYGKKYDGDREMLDDILDVMIAQGLINEIYRDMYVQKFSIPSSIEKLKEDSQEIVDSDSSDTLDTIVFQNAATESISWALDTLTPREEKVLRLRFGLDDGVQRTLEDVGKRFNVNGARIRQIEAKAIRKLRLPYRSKKLRDLLSDEYTTGDNSYNYILDGTISDRDDDYNYDEQRPNRI